MRNQKDIENEAKKVLVEHGLYSIPVDPVVLVNKLGFKVNNAVFSDESIAGLTSKRAGKPLFLINQSDHPFRKRFTIAHELAHHFLHLFEDKEDIIHKKIDMFRVPGPPDEAKFLRKERIMEIEANRLAAALLMPEELVREQWKISPSVEEMARIFNVSVEAMGYRVGDLGLE